MKNEKQTEEERKKSKEILDKILKGSKSIVGVENPKRVFRSYFLPKKV